MSGYTKLFASIIHSTIWREPDHVRLVWVTMLAMVNSDGVVEASVPGLADAARVTVDACRRALAVLEAPDPDSRTPDLEGRRVVEVAGGWRVVNFERYRERLSTEDRKAKSAARAQRYRERRRAVAGKSVTPKRDASVTGRDARDESRESLQTKEESETEAKADRSADVDPSLSGESPATAPEGSNGAGGGGTGKESWGTEPDGGETPCPNLEPLAVECGMVRDFAEHYGVSESSVLDAVREFTAYWMIGGGAGKRRRHWPSRLRQRLKELGEQGKFKPPGLVEHEQSEGLSEHDKRQLAKARAWRAERDREGGSNA